MHDVYVSELKDGAVGSCRAARLICPGTWAPLGAISTAERARAVATLPNSIFHFAVFLTWLFPVSWQKLKLLLVYRAVKVIVLFLNLALQFIYQIPLSLLPQSPNSNGNRKLFLTKNRKRTQGIGTDASLNLGQPSYRYPPSFVHCSDFKDEKIQRLSPASEILFFQRTIINLLLISIQAQYWSSSSTIISFSEVSIYKGMFFVLKTAVIISVPS